MHCVSRRMVHVFEEVVTLGAGGVPLDAQLTGAAASREHGEVLPGLSPGRMSSASIRGAPSHGARPLDAQLASLGRGPRAPRAQAGYQCSTSRRAQWPAHTAGGTLLDAQLVVREHENRDGTHPTLSSPAASREHARDIC